MSRYVVTIERLNEIALINLRCTEAVATAIGDTLGFVVPVAPFVSTQTGASEIVRLSPDQWWIRSTSGEESDLYDQLRIATADRFAALTVISDHFQGFAVTGTDVNAVLSQAVSVDLQKLQAGSVLRTRFARTGATLFTREPGARAEVFVESSYADYIEQWFEMAAGVMDEADSGSA